MNWWLIPVAFGVVVLLRWLWVAAFHPDETVSAMPQLDGYVPSERSSAEPAQEAPADTPPGEPPTGADDESGDEGDIWIDLDIEPLFPSSDSSATHLVDLTEEQDAEPRSS